MIYLLNNVLLFKGQLGIEVQVVAVIQKLVRRMPNVQFM